MGWNSLLRSLICRSWTSLKDLCFSDELSHQLSGELSDEHILSLTKILKFINRRSTIAASQPPIPFLYVQIIFLSGGVNATYIYLNCVFINIVLILARGSIQASGCFLILFYFWIGESLKNSKSV